MHAGLCAGDPSGERFSAPHAVLAIPLNTWRGIDFPGLSAAKRRHADAGHAGSALKLFALTRNVPGRLTAVAYNGRVRQFESYRELDDRQIVLGWTVKDGTDALDAAAIERELRAFAPKAEVLDTFSHDWNADPFAQGVWLTARPGMALDRGSVLSKPEGRVASAGGDVAVETEFAGWMEGALRTGEHAARYVLARHAADGSGPTAAI